MALEICQQIRTQLRYRDLAIRGDKLFAVGGREPSSGSRSAYCAAAACWSLASGELLWEQVLTKNKSFARLALAADRLVAVLPHNFTREPTGLIVLSLTDGSILNRLSMGADQALIGHDDTCLVAALRDGASMLRVLGSSWDLPGHEIVISGLPGYADQDLQHVAALPDGTFVLTFSSVKKDRLSYSHQRWSRDLAPLGTIVETTHSRVEVGDNALVTYDTQSKRGNLCLYAIDSGRKLHDVKPSPGELQAVTRGPHDLWLAAFVSGALATIDAQSGAVQILAQSRPTPLWRAMQYDAPSELLVVMETSDFRNPCTEFLAYAWPR